jgi:hypothetical protein
MHLVPIKPGADLIGGNIHRTFLLSPVLALLHVCQERLELAAHGEPD